MDINTVTRYRRPTTRDELALAPGERFLGGGTWLFSEPQPGVTGFVDLGDMGWAPLEISAEGLRIAATCTIAELVGLPPQPGWAAQPLFLACANALLASHKIWNLATVGGNICRTFAAGSMISLAATLDGVAEIWTPGGGEREASVASLVTGNGTNSLAEGELLRAVRLPLTPLRARTALRKLALAELGRSGVVVSGRVDEDGSSVFAVTAATERPVVRRFASIPDAAALRDSYADVPYGDGGWYSDPLGSADWRRGASLALLADVRDELSAGASS